VRTYELVVFDASAPAMPRFLAAWRVQAPPRSLVGSAELREWFRKTKSDPRLPLHLDVVDLATSELVTWARYTPPEESS